MFEFPEVDFPLAKWIDVFVDWVTIQGEFIFDAVSRWLLVPLLGLERGLLWLPWFVIIAVLAFGAWRLSGWKLALGTTLGLLFIGVLGLWDLAMSTLAIVIAATILAILVGIPINCDGSQ
jgi:glycine betaine/proline transport system permease protein